MQAWVSGCFLLTASPVNNVCTWNAAAFTFRDIGLRRMKSSRGAFLVFLPAIMEQTSAVLSPACIYTFVTMKTDLCSFEKFEKRKRM